MGCFLAGSLDVDILFQQVRNSCPYGRDSGYASWPQGRKWPLKHVIYLCVCAVGFDALSRVGSWLIIWLISRDVQILRKPAATFGIALF